MSPATVTSSRPSAAYQTTGCVDGSCRGRCAFASPAGATSSGSDCATTLIRGDLSPLPGRTTRLSHSATRQHQGVPLPILTDRLWIRPYEPGDLAELHDVLYGDAEAMALLGGARDLPGQRASIERSMLQQELGGYSFWPVIERETGLLVGEAGLFPLSPGGPDIALGYAFG